MTPPLPRFQRFTSAGGRTKWENFRLPDRPVIGSISITAVEGPDIEDYPALRVQDCRVGGKHWTPGKKVVSFAAPDVLYMGFLPRMRSE